MTELAACPSEIALRELLADTLPAPAQAELTLHLETCAPCRSRLEGLAAGADSWQAARSLRPKTAGEDAAPGLRHAVEMLAAETPTLGGGQRPNAEDVRPFLGASDAAGHLGRLDHYQILELVGRGGMGVVFKAFDEKLRRLVAVKVLAPHLASVAGARQRFVREARAAAAITHEHVVAIHAVEDSGPLPYLVMQFVAGQSLQQLLDQRGPFDALQVARIGIEAAMGLAAAHAQGLVHRDIKPGNLLLENGSQRVKITDFGLARAVTDASMTESGVVAGTPAYMAPEQAKGDAVDHRADLFSLGSVLYSLCTGQMPFPAPNPLAVLKRLAEEDATPIRTVNGSVPQWLCELIGRLHAKDPTRRPQSAAEVADLLGHHLAPTGGASSDEPSIRAPKLRRTRARPMLVVALAGIAALGGVLAWRLLDRNEEEFKAPPLPAPKALADRPSPLDELTWNDVPLPLRAIAGLAEPARAPKDLVAVLGDARFMVSNPGPASWPGISGDGKTLALPCGNSVSLFDARTGAPVTILSGHRGRVYAVAFHPKMRRLAVTTWDAKHAVSIWDLDAAKIVQTLKGHGATVLRVAYSSDGKLLASCSDDGTARLWDASTGKELHVLAGHKDPVGNVIFSSDGARVFTGSKDFTVKVWNAATGKLIATLKDHYGSVTGLALSHDGSQLATGSETECKVWDAETLTERHRFAQPAAWIAFLPDRTLLTARHNHGGGSVHDVHRFDVVAGKELEPLSLEVRGGHAVFDVHPDGSLLYAMRCQLGESRLRTYDPKTGKNLMPYQGHISEVYTAAVSPNGKLAASGGADRAVLLWDLERLHGAVVPPMRRLTKLKAEVTSIAFRPDGATLATASLDGAILLWDVARSEQTGSLEGLSGPPSRLAFSPDGRTLAAGGPDGSIHRWDVDSRKPLESYSWHEGAVRSVAFSRDGRKLGSAGQDRTVRWGDATTGRQLGSITRLGPARDVAFSPDGATLASVGEAPDASLRLCDLETRRETFYPLHDHNSVTIAYHPLGKLIVTGGNDARLRLWEPLGDLRRMRTWGPGAFGFVVHQASFTPEGRYVATANANGLVYFLRLAAPGETPRVPDPDP